MMAGVQGRNLRKTGVCDGFDFIQMANLSNLFFSILF